MFRGDFFLNLQFRHDGSGDTVLRGRYGFYYDSIFMKSVLQNNGAQNISVFGSGRNPASCCKILFKSFASENIESRHPTMVEGRIRDSLVRLEIISAERRVVLVPLSEHHIKALGIIRDREDYSGSPRCEWYILAAHRNFLGSESINLGANFLPPRTI